MTTYHRIQFQGDGAIKTVILKNARFQGDFLSGIEVNKEGDEVHRPGQFDERFRMIHRSAIIGTRVMFMNQKYAMLQELK